MCVCLDVCCVLTSTTSCVVHLLAVLWVVALLGSIILRLNTDYFVHSPAYSSEYSPKYLKKKNTHTIYKHKKHLVLCFHAKTKAILPPPEVLEQQGQPFALQ